eukprot:3425866-Prymnesium_polylepis.2
MADAWMTAETAAEAAAGARGLLPMASRGVRRLARRSAARRDRLSSSIELEDGCAPLPQAEKQAQHRALVHCDAAWCVAHPQLSGLLSRCPCGVGIAVGWVRFARVGMPGPCG